jgi:asparagine synthase (glutamine-hydrolysing)
MCGIGGYVDFRGGRNRADVLETMVARLKHRGPDDDGVLIEGPCGLAHTRLSIVDRAGGAQPMRFADADLALTYNGEIYNHPDLMPDLKARGAPFHTRSDTEVLLRGLALDGPGFLGKLDGMFAFAAWDRRRERLLLARDPFGEKPLFYATPAPGLLVFGSEIKAVLTHPDVDGGLDEAGLREVLRFRARYGEGTLRRGVRQLRPGTLLEFSLQGASAATFFDLRERVARAEADQRRVATGERVEAALALFTASVRRRLIADVPIGAYLSGGLDSSLVTAAMRAARGPGEEIHTFSVGFEGDARSEVAFARRVSGILKTRHHELSVGPEAFTRRWSGLSTFRDSPLSEPAEVAFAAMSEAAKPVVSVALSGEGADEMFAGYPKYRFAGAPWPLRLGLRAIGPDRASAIAGRLGVDSTRTLIAARALAQPEVVDRLTQWFSDGDRADLAGLLPGLEWSDSAWSETIAAAADALDRTPQQSELRRMQAMDCLTWLAGNLLPYGDRMSMAHGLEVRLPFLDTALASFALALPDRLKVRRGAGKWLMRQWRLGDLPSEILSRPKWGFRVPLAQWFRGPLRGMLLDHLTEPTGLCARYGDTRAINRMIEAHMSGAADLSARLWKLVSTEVWYQSALSGDGLEPERVSRAPAADAAT